MKKNIYSNGWCEYKIGSGQPIVMLHGFGYSAEILFPLANRLSKYYQVILYDLPGFGNSISQHDEISLDIIISELAHLVPINAHYIGWSLGGLFTLYFACKFPLKINKLISIASSPCFIAHNQWPGISLNSINQFKANLKTNFESAIKKFIWEHLYPKNKTHFQQIITVVFKNIASSEKIYFSYLNLLINTNLLNYLPTVNINHLYLLGKMDSLIPSPLRLEKYNQKITNTYYNGGHMPFISHLYEINSYIMDYLNES